MQSGSRWSIEGALCLAALALLAALAIVPLFAHGQIPFAVRGVLYDPPWEEARQEGLGPPVAGGPSAEALRFYPWHAYLNHAAQSGDSLLWNPLEGCGAPFFAVWRTRCLSPFSIPLRILSLRTGLAAALLLKVIVAGWCAYYLARKFGFARPFALLVGVAFEFSGPVFLRLAWPMSDMFPWLPLWIILAEQFTWGIRRWWPLGALTAAVTALGGDPESFVVIAGFTGLYLVLRLSVERAGLAQTVRDLGALAGTVAVGLALAAVQIAPFIEFLFHAAATGRETAGGVPGLKDLVVCFFPHFFGTAPVIAAADGSLRYLDAVRLLHAGLISFWLLPVWFTVRRFAVPMVRHRVDALLLAAGILTLLALTWDRGLGRISVLYLIPPRKLIACNALALALMSAAAAQAWVRLNVEECQAALKRLTVYVPLLALLIATCVWGYRDVPRPDAASLWRQLAVSGGITFMIVLLMGATLVRPSVRIMGYGLAALCFLSLQFSFGRMHQSEDAGASFPETPFITTLQQNAERISGAERLKQWPLAGNLIAQVYCPSGVELDRHASYFERVAEDPLLLRRAGAPGFLLTKEDIQGRFAFLRPTLAIRHVFPSGAVLFNDLETRPRAWVSYDWRAGNKLVAGALNSNFPPFVEGAPPPTGPSGGPPAKASFSAPEQSDRVEMDVDSPRAGMLILADAFYPGWKASVDGASTRVYPVDGLFRGVEIKEGKHHVVFQYAPWSVRFGLGVTLIAALGLLASLARSLRPSPVQSDQSG